MTQEEEDRFIISNVHASEDEAQDALKARNDAQTRLDRANESSHAWRTIAAQKHLNIERKTAKSATPQAAPLSEGPSISNKAEFVRQMIDAAGTTGVTPSEIRASASKAGMQLTPGYPYTILSKMVQAGKIMKGARGHYVNKRTLFTSSA